MSSFVRITYLLFLDIVAAVGLFALVGYAAIDTTPGVPTEPAWVSLTAATLVAGPIMTRRPWPLISLAVSLTAALATLLSGVIPLVATGAPVIAVAIVLYFVATEKPKRQSVPALAICLGSHLVIMVVGGFTALRVGTWQDRAFGLTFAWLVLVSAWTIGFVARERRRRAVESAARHTEQAVAAERLRIARELHDIVAHSMSLIAVKAGVGNHVAAQRPEEALEALRVIEATSRSSLAEMRHLLSMLRSEVDGPERAPAPGPAGIPALVERARSAGVTVSVTLDDTATVPEGVGLSVYRIVQEALTNVVRHAAPACCTVTVAVTAEEVRVEVANDGPAVEESQGGHGIIGMRERVAVYGGTFAAGPRAEGGWCVSAVLPL